MNKAPSGKELGQKSLLNLQTVSKSVDKQGTGQTGTAATKGAASTNQQQYLVINSSKEIKARDSGKRGREGSGPSHAGTAGIAGYGNQASNAGGNLKEKRLS